jgi:hypothetical protein
MSPLLDCPEFGVKVSRWNLSLDDAQSNEEVLAVMRDYVASLAPHELAILPEKCRPGRVKTEDDVSYWAFVLAQHQCGPENREQRNLHQEVLNHFLHASIRISQLNKRG